MRISYLEIYNEAGYDLLDPSHETKGLEDLPKVSLMEDDHGKIHLKNLSAQLARSEEEALNLLFVGDTNRMISETPMNMASSRSHCIFTVGIEARKEGSDVVRRSKLHLVDLAGSERVKKTGIEGTVFREARYINLSLHYLEQVIIALQVRMCACVHVCMWRMQLRQASKPQIASSTPPPRLSLSPHTLPPSLPLLFHRRRSLCRIATR